MSSYLDLGLGFSILNNTACLELVYILLISEWTITAHKRMALIYESCIETSTDLSAGIMIGCTCDLWNVAIWLISAYKSVGLDKCG